MELHRLHLTDGEPFMIETVFLPHARYSCVPPETEDTLEPVFLDACERGLLNTHDKALGLLVEATTRDTNGLASEFSRSIVRGDRSRYVLRSRNVLTD